MEERNASILEFKDGNSVSIFVALVFRKLRAGQLVADLQIAINNRNVSSLCFQSTNRQETLLLKDAVTATGD